MPTPDLTIGHHAVPSAPHKWELETAPHLLISGRPGAGKTVVLKSLIAQAAMQGMLTLGLYEDSSYRTPGRERETLEELVEKAYQGGFPMPALIAIDGYSNYSFQYGELLEELLTVAAFTGASYHLLIADSSGRLPHKLLALFSKRLYVGLSPDEAQRLGLNDLDPAMLTGKHGAAVVRDSRAAQRTTYLQLQAAGELYSTLTLRP